MINQRESKVIANLTPTLIQLQLIPLGTLLLLNASL